MVDIFLKHHITIFLVYVIFNVLLTCLGTTRPKTLEDYATGYHKFSAVTLVFATIAAAIGPQESITVSSKAFAMGAGFTMSCPGYLFRWLIMATLFGRMITVLKAANCLTLADVMRFFYGSWGRYVSAALSLVMSCLMVTICIEFTIVIVEKYINTPFVLSAFIIIPLISFYSIFGGAHTVVITDVMQFILFSLMFLCAFVFALDKPDFQQIWHNIPYDKIHFSLGDIPNFFGFAIYNLIPLTGPVFIQRGLMSRDERQLKTVFTFTGISLFFVSVIIALIGIISFGINKEINPHEAIFFFVDYAADKTIIGFIAIGLMAVAMSSASAILNSANIIVVRDMAFPLFPSLKEKYGDITIARLCGVLLLFASALIALIKDHKEIMVFLDNFWDPIISTPLILGLVGIRIRAEKFKYVTIITFFVVSIAGVIRGSFDVFTLVLGILVSVLTTYYLRDKNVGIADKAEIIA